MVSRILLCIPCRLEYFVTDYRMDWSGTQREGIHHSWSRRFWRAQVWLLSHYQSSSELNPCFQILLVNIIYDEWILLGCNAGARLFCPFPCWPWLPGSMIKSYSEDRQTNVTVRSCLTYILVSFRIITWVSWWNGLCPTHRIAEISSIVIFQLVHRDPQPPLVEVTHVSIIHYLW